MSVGLFVCGPVCVGVPFYCMWPYLGVSVALSLCLLCCLWGRLTHKHTHTPSDTARHRWCRSHRHVPQSLRGMVVVVVGYWSRPLDHLDALCVTCCLILLHCIQPFRFTEPIYSHTYTLTHTHTHTPSYTHTHTHTNTHNHKQLVS